MKNRKKWICGIAGILRTDNSVSHYHILSQTLSPDERIRAKRFHSEKDRNRFVICHGILRILLASYLSVEPGELQFSFEKYGKPVLADSFGRVKIHFSMSRSGDKTLFAFTRSGEIGVDVEQMRNIFEMDQIVERCFSITITAFVLTRDLNQSTIEIIY